MNKKDLEQLIVKFLENKGYFVRQVLIKNELPESNTISGYITEFNSEIRIRIRKE